MASLSCLRGVAFPLRDKSFRDDFLKNRILARGPKIEWERGEERGDLSIRSRVVKKMSFGVILRSFFVFLLFSSPFFLVEIMGELRLVYPEKSFLKQIGVETPVIPSSTATFGSPPYGSETMGKLCAGPAKDKDNPHCEAENYELENCDEDDFEKQRFAKIVVVLRGGCAFVTKVLQAQNHKGANAVIVVDQSDDPESYDRDITHLLMGDNKYGHLVYIPSVLINQRNGEVIYNALIKEKKDIYVTLSWMMPMENGRTIAHFTISPESEKSMRFLSQYAPIAKSLYNDVQNLVVYKFFDVGKRDYSNQCLDVKSGTYCCSSPDEITGGDITGQDVCKEVARQIVMFSQMLVKKQVSPKNAPPGTVKTIEFPELYWNYVEVYLNECLVPDVGTTNVPVDQRFGKQACSERVLKEVLKIKDDEFKDFQNKYNEEIKNHTLFQAYRDYNQLEGDFVLYINQVRYSGDIEPEPVARALCSSFPVRPKECDDVASPYIDNIDNSEPNEIPGIRNGEFSIKSAFLILAFIIAGITMVFVLCHRRKIISGMRDEVMAEVKEQLQYVSLADVGEKSGNGGGSFPDS